MTLFDLFALALVAQGERRREETRDPSCARGYNMLNSLLKVTGGVLLTAAAAFSARHPYLAIDVMIVIGLLLVVEGIFGIVAWW
jgi:hypothetical protein